MPCCLAECPLACKSTDLISALSLAVMYLVLLLLLCTVRAEALALIQAPEQLSFEQLCGLPCEVQLQVQSLECLHMLVQQLPADYPLPAGLGCMLCQLLLSQSLMEHRTERQDQQHPQLLGQGVQRQRDVAVQVTQCVQQAEIPAALNLKLVKLNTW